MRLIVSPDEDGNWLQQGAHVALGWVLVIANMVIIVGTILLVMHLLGF